MLCHNSSYYFKMCISEITKKKKKEKIYTTILAGISSRWGDYLRLFFSCRVFSMLSKSSRCKTKYLAHNRCLVNVNPIFPPTPPLFSKRTIVLDIMTNGKTKGQGFPRTSPTMGRYLLMLCFFRGSVALNPTIIHIQVSPDSEPGSA